MVVFPPDNVGDDWQCLSMPDAVAHYLAEHFGLANGSWMVKRLYYTTYAYREMATGCTVIAKFYTIKKGEQAAVYAEYELERITRAARLTSEVVPALCAWRGVLLLSYIEGYTLESCIASGREPDIERVTRFLVQLHNQQVCCSPDFLSAIVHEHKVIDQLALYGTLDSAKASALRWAVDGWAHQRFMWNYTPVFVHGDATTGNFLFSQSGQLVVLDWEYAGAGDAAADLGRLCAELEHSLQRNGAALTNALELVLKTYRVCDETLRRSPFYQAISTLRIARNVWLSAPEKALLVDKASALLLEG